MSEATRTARLLALAKLNLDLRVLHRRPDGYHELRTVFQTVSLADQIDVSFTAARRTRITTESSIGIPGNLVERAARLSLDSMKVAGHVRFRLQKRIPMGAGLGGGSSDAAAVLLALPVLAGRRIDLAELMSQAAELGSDVSFFLLGGTALGIGRGTELYPLPDAPFRAAVVIAPRVHVATAEAYAALGPHLTAESQQNKIVSFQSLLWCGLRGSPRNDFQGVVFAQNPPLSSLRRTLEKAGGAPALMTGSGSAVYGLFRTRADAINAAGRLRALKSIGEAEVFPVSLVSRARYRALWYRQLRPHLEEEAWPPPSRYARPTATNRFGR
jgi:4-diphosphocytidyl-2-C-methyl-D-erythritol kinase